MVTVYRHDGRYLGCMGIDTWQWLAERDIGVRELEARFATGQPERPGPTAAEHAAIVRNLHGRMHRRLPHGNGPGHQPNCAACAIEQSLAALVALGDGQPEEEA
jgi:hypothetical protein